MYVGRPVLFVEKNEVREGIIIGPMCISGLYIQPTDREDFPRLIFDKKSIMLLDEEEEK